jgi:NADPH2:quinone reductase
MPDHISYCDDGQTGPSSRPIKEAGKTVKALLCRELGSPADLRIESIGEPEAAADEAIIEVKAAGLNFFDTLIVAGKYQFKPVLPFSPGAEIAGKVTEVGSTISHVERGARVMAFIGWGGLREKVAVKSQNIIALPEGVSYEAAAGLQVAYGTAYHALKERGELKTGESLLVLGAAGGTGQAAVELGKVMGARVIAAASAYEKLEFCRALGADEVINSGTEDVKERIRQLTQGSGADVIFDPVGGALSETAFRSIAWGGRHLVVGFAAGDIPRLPLNLPLLKGASLIGVFWGEHVRRAPQRHRANMAQLLELLVAGRINPHIDRLYPLEEAKQALADISARRIKGKAVISLA